HLGKIPLHKRHCEESESRMHALLSHYRFIALFGSVFSSSFAYVPAKFPCADMVWQSHEQNRYSWLWMRKFHWQRAWFLPPYPQNNREEVYGQNGSSHQHAEADAAHGRLPERLLLSKESFGIARAGSGEEHSTSVPLVRSFAHWSAPRESRRPAPWLTPR